MKVITFYIKKLLSFLKSVFTKKREEHTIKTKKLLVWWLINAGDAPRQLEEDERQILALFPIVQTLFPGINFYSISGFSQVAEVASPVLKKQFPELVSVSAESIDPEEEVDINEFLPSEGYEWRQSDWKKKLKQKLEKL